MANCLIGLGSNLGDRGENLRAAIEQLKQLPQSTFLAASSFRDTKPAGGPAAQSPYLNAAARIESSLEPLQLLAELQRIENELGRTREERWGPRTIDLDLLLYDKVEMETPELTLPHPRMSFRRFVLEPAAEIAVEMKYPINGWTIGELFEFANEGRMVILLAPTHSAYFRRSPATSLLQSLSSLPQVNAVFSEPETARVRSRAEELVARRKQARKSRSNVIKADATWFVMNEWLGQSCAEMFWRDPNRRAAIARTYQMLAKERLVVVFDPERSPQLEMLDLVRRLPQCGPVLWIPGIPLEQAKQEVIAAMAAME